MLNDKYFEIFSLFIVINVVFGEIQIALSIKQHSNGRQCIVCGLKGVVAVCIWHYCHHYHCCDYCAAAVVVVVVVFVAEGHKCTLHTSFLLFQITNHPFGIDIGIEAKNNHIHIDCLKCVNELRSRSRESLPSFFGPFLVSFHSLRKQFPISIRF